MGSFHPQCNRKDCFAYTSGFKEWNGGGCCTVLTDNEFHGKPCPFFKTKDEFKYKWVHKEIKKTWNR